MTAYHRDLTVQVEDRMAGTGNVQIWQVLGFYLECRAYESCLTIGSSLHLHGQSHPSKKAYTYLIIHTGVWLSLNYRASSIHLMTTEQDISRLAASGMTRLFGLSMTSSVTMRLRRTGRQ